MRPALQRLVARPSGRKLLRLLVGDEGAVLSYAPSRLESRRRGRRGFCLREYSGVAIATRERKGHEGEDDNTKELGRTAGRGIGFEKAASAHLDKVFPYGAGSATESHEQIKSPDFISSAPDGSPSKQEEFSRGLATLGLDQPKAGTKILAPKRQIIWEEAMFNHERLEFESNLALRPTGDQERLLDSTQGNDMSLWAMLLGYRKRIYGTEGIRTFWTAAQERNIQLPTTGHLADKLWHTFLALGFKEPDILESIYEYAKRNKHQHGLYWSRLYPQIVGHYLRNHEGGLALKWHDRLGKLHQPGPRTFAEMCRGVVSKGGDLGTLRQIYNSQTHRKIYAKIIPLLCQKEQYKLALQWHSFLCKRGDIPYSAKVAESLVQYLATYDPPSARNVTQDLLKAGASFASSLSQKLEENTKISREMMNIIHGETMQIPVKKYNDELGARWFATTWVSLDVAINAVHALGVQEIGPLSLQAIALRDLDPEAIVSRIEQLKDLNISIGSSLFSRAVEKFAREGKLDLLDGLLTSDQHPDELQNFELQEALLASYAHGADWTQYRRTLEIRLVASMSPEIEKRNLELRMVVSTSDTSVALRGLEDMLIDGIPVKGATISLLLKHTLGPRRMGQRPISLRNGLNGKNGLIRSIAMLKAIMKSGTYVHPNLWHEIIRRTGMLGHMSSLRNLCSWLATCYGPQNHYNTVPWLQRYRVPADLPTSHGLHPLCVLFPPRLQKSIVEWGFIASKPQHSHCTRPSHILATPDAVKKRSSAMTSGIYILKKLNSLGVHIDRRSVRKAIFDRLIMYYGPGYSNRRYNEKRKLSIGTLEDAAKQIDEALGGEYFTAVELQEIVQQMALVRWQRRERRRMRRIGLPSKDPRNRVLFGSGAAELPPVHGTP
ncbi:hypothetical protein BKA65DRAFT_503625 [Rhexocercosporidium sp. MPI-PUGE-AT-0058]|nr:hypothetical protein BKA65DRAFT_503625 [Rhexocercosporidium sp. MPI-PUGE-AT-0058]